MTVHLAHCIIFRPGLNFAGHRSAMKNSIHYDAYIYFMRSKERQNSEWWAEF